MRIRAERPQQEWVRVFAGLVRHQFGASSLFVGPIKANEQRRVLVISCDRSSIACVCCSVVLLRGAAHNWFNRSRVAKT